MAARYAADPPDARRTIALDDLTAVFHRPSSATHLLGPPAPQILDALAEGPADVGELIARLARQHDLIGDAEPAIAARLAELEAVGLVLRA